jgi:membrane associated rhomboid family serine protease
MAYVVLLGIALVIFFRSTTSVERRKYLFAVLKRVDLFFFYSQHYWQELEPFRARLRERTRFAPITPTIALLNLAVMAGMIVHPHLLNDPDPLVSWGASFGPRTANGEWWRLITTVFVHSSFLDLFINLLALVPLGLMLERIVGPAAFAAVYLTAGMFSSLFNLSMFPVEVRVGAAGAVAGVYAFMLAVSLWGVSQRPRLLLPMITAKGLAVCGGLFLAYAWLTGAAAVVVVGFAAGLITGLTVARGVNTQRTPAVRMAATVATMCCVAIVTAVPLRGITDARRDIAAVIETEERTVAAFKSALEEYTEGRMTDQALAGVIDRVVVPDLRYVAERLSLVDETMVPSEQRPQIAAAAEYLQLRDESWTLRANALRSGKMSILWTADRKEALSLEAFRRIRPGTRVPGRS